MSEWLLQKKAELSQRRERAFEAWCAGELQDDQYRYTMERYRQEEREAEKEDEAR